MNSTNTKLHSREAYTVMSAMTRGFKRRCPHCGQGAIFSGYLKQTDHCENCTAPTGEIRADDLPSYLTIIIVGHIIVPILLIVEAKFHPELWVQMTVWPTLTLILTLSLLPFIKGATVGLMWHINMKGNEQR